MRSILMWMALVAMIAAAEAQTPAPTIEEVEAQIAAAEARQAEAAKAAQASRAAEAARKAELERQARVKRDAVNAELERQARVKREAEDQAKRDAEAVAAQLAAQQATLIIKTDTRCELSINGEARGWLEADATERLEVSPGEQLIDCAGPGRRVEQTARLESGNEAVVQLVLHAPERVERSEASENQVRSDKFLLENKHKKNVVSLPSGIQYRVIEEGNGPRPTVKSTVTVHYRGSLISGQEFDSSFARGVPAKFPVNGVITGWQEVLPLMRVGDTWQVFIPSSKAYGAGGSPPVIGPNQALVFEIKLLDEE